MHLPAPATATHVFATREANILIGLLDQARRSATRIASADSATALNVTNPDVAKQEQRWRGDWTKVLARRHLRSIDAFYSL